MAAQHNATNSRETMHIAGETTSTETAPNSATSEELRATDSRLAELAADLPGLHTLPPDALARALELHTLEQRQAEQEQLDTGARTDRPAGTLTRWCPDCATIQPLDQFLPGSSRQRVGRCGECRSLSAAIQRGEANDVEELLDVTLTAREQITLHAGLASAAQTMLAMAADAGGPAGLARWLRYRVDRAEACGDFRAVVRLMSIIGAIAGLQAAVTPEEMESRIAGVRGFDKHRRRRAKQRTKKARQHHKGTTGQESSDAAS